jgi:Ca2+-binding EF-hand superfamily protein
VVRPLSEMHGDGDYDISYPFFMSYYFISSIVLFNIIVAVLLDEFISAATLSKLEQRMDRTKGMAMALEPLLSPLSAFRTPYDLERSINAVFDVLDQEDKGVLSFADFQTGLANLATDPPIEISKDDWNLMTEEGAFCSADGSLDLQLFHQLMRRQLSVFILRKSEVQTSRCACSCPTCIELCAG